ncbi:MAG: putative metal-binding motif-containing protein [Myxococcales bacterium]|nr:putative metal-binding motif-containing protein [Myxococcales bacterium]MCB9642251.1 putative metal-binding motif-containing protein [Myxococcales bacterium]
MKIAFRGILLRFSLLTMGFWAFNCAIITDPPVQNCGPGYTLTSTGCQLTAAICSPDCSADQKCVDGKCVDRFPDSNNIACATPCEPGYVCDETLGRCVSIEGCKSACPQGYTCFRGSCVLRVECNPPCPQLGYICDNGLCARICAPECASGEECKDGVCQKRCNPDCTSGQFCQAGTCRTLQDADKDGFTNDRDCDDNDPARNPNAVEVCNGKDTNCDGIVDNIEPVPCYEGDSGTLGRGECKAGLTACKDAKQICADQVIPSTEICDSKDNDCNGMIDDGINCP